MGRYHLPSCKLIARDQTSIGSNRINIRYGVVANIARSHRAAQGSIPCTGVSFCLFCPFYQQLFFPSSLHPSLLGRRSTNGSSQRCRLAKTFSAPAGPLFLCLWPSRTPLSETRSSVSICLPGRAPFHLVV